MKQIRVVHKSGKFLLFGLWDEMAYNFPECHDSGGMHVPVGAHRTICIFLTIRFETSIHKYQFNINNNESLLLGQRGTYLDY